MHTARCLESDAHVRAPGVVETNEAVICRDIFMGLRCLGNKITFFIYILICLFTLHFLLVFVWDIVGYVSE